LESIHCALNPGSENGLGTWVRIITEQSGNEANSTAWNETKKMTCNEAEVNEFELKPRINTG